MRRLTALLALLLGAVCAVALAGATSAPASAATLTANRTAYLVTMYRSVVPAAERKALVGHYTIGYNVPGLSCGTGCTDRVGNRARSSFDSTFFTMSTAYQRNTLAHEAAHAYGFLYIKGYATASWAGLGGWQAQFHKSARGFVRTYDAEAWASCIAWKQSGFNNRVDQITHVCTSAARTLANAHIA